MGKVLKDKDDTNGVCVYVAPTKALINQVAGIIHVRVMNANEESVFVFQVQFIRNLVLYLEFLHEIIECRCKHVVY